MNPSSSTMDEWARTAPENLLFVSPSRMIEYVQTGLSSMHTKEVLVAELVARWCLSGDLPIDQCLCGLLGTDWEDFKDWYRIECAQGVGASVPNRLWRGLHPFSVACESEVRRRLSELLTADGFIPIIENDTDAAFVPFTLASADRTEILDTEGNPVQGWRGAYEEALTGDSHWRCTLQCRVRHGLPRFTGRSLMLPVKMAVWRRLGKVPRYDPLRVIATGAFDVQGKLVPVDDDLKRAGFSRTFKYGLFFCPWSSTATDDPEFVRRIDDRSESDGLATTLSKELEASGLARLDVKYVLGRLSDIERDVRSENYNRWGRISDRVSAMLDAVDEERYPEKRLLLLMLKCAALRHSGQTVECMDMTSKAIDLAQRHGWRDEVLRLQIESLVIAQDEGDFDSVRTLSDSLEDRLAECGGRRDFLSMRFYGTMGQAHVWGALIGANGFSRDEAGECFKKALKCAFELDDEGEIARDLNYCHLWHAFFSPGSQEENDAYERAKNHIERNLSSKKSQRVNMYYLLRQRSVAMFQGWKRTGNAPTVESIEQVKLPLADADGWLCASNRRCIGALLAANGLYKEAARAFEDGESALPERACEGSPVLAYVRLALLVQACVSLDGDCEGLELCRRYAVKAECLYGPMSGSKLFCAARVDRWMDALHCHCSPCEMPDVYY